jgi:hypothetical protein
MRSTLRPLAALATVALIRASYLNVAHIGTSLTIGDT